MVDLSISYPTGLGKIANILTRLGNLGSVDAKTVNRLHSGFAHQLHPDLSSQRSVIIFVGKPGCNALFSEGILADHKTHLRMCHTLNCARKLVGLDQATGVLSLVIDVDSLGGILEIYDELRKIRNELPQIPVVLLSSEFSVDDFGTERLALCDASIRVSFAHSLLDFSIFRMARANNEIWQRRLRDLRRLND